MSPLQIVLRRHIFVVRRRDERRFLLRLGQCLHRRLLHQEQAVCRGGPPLQLAGLVRGVGHGVVLHLADEEVSGAHLGGGILEGLGEPDCVPDAQLLSAGGLGEGRGRGSHALRRAPT